MGRPYVDLMGRKFGRLTVIKYMGSKEIIQRAVWLCKCECGNEKEIVGAHLTSKNGIKSCGCITKENSKYNLPHKKKHGMSGSKFYNIWNGMLTRCNNSNDKHYKNYGGRGIKICDKWLNFEGFYEDMYSTYKEGLSIDRINVNGNYEPSNCRWATTKEQGNNRTNNHYILYKGERLTLMELSEKYNINYDLLKRRLYKGWDIERAVTTEKQRLKRKKV